MGIERVEMILHLSYSDAKLLKITQNEIGNIYYYPTSAQTIYFKI